MAVPACPFQPPASRAKKSSQRRRHICGGGNEFESQRSAVGKAVALAAQFLASLSADGVLDVTGALIAGLEQGAAMATERRAGALAA